MNAVISGQAGTAVCIEKDRIFSFSIHAPQDIIERHTWDLPYILTEASDVSRLDNVTHEQVVERLDVAWRQDRCLQLILLLLDITSDQDIREASAECVDDFMRDTSIKDFVANRLYMAPLPDTADLPEALAICMSAFRNTARRFLEELERDQPRISRLFEIWEEIPVQTFGSPKQKSDFYKRAIKYGVFHAFALEDAKPDLLLLRYLGHESFRGDAHRARIVFQALADPLRHSHAKLQTDGPITAIAEHPDERSIDKNIRWARGKHGSYVQPKGKKRAGHEVFESVERQRTAIKKHLIEGQQEKALRFVDQLVVRQRRDSKPEHVAKSLCDLAQFAKDELGSPEIQLQFALRAVTEAPKDSFSYATLGDAYRSLGDFSEAQEAYHTAGLLGDERIALIGKGEIFKDMGHFPDALAAFNECIDKYPDDIVCLNGLASTLTTSGDFAAALRSYDEILSNFREDSVTLAGRAQVLRDMGYLEEALEELTKVSINYPNQLIPQDARAEVLREMGRLNEALEAFETIQKKFPSQVAASLGIARVLRDKQMFQEAIHEYQKIKQMRPFDSGAATGLADTYKRIGRLEEALREYDQIIGKFKRTMGARNGKASVLIVQGHYDEALKLLPDYLPATQGEWVAYHIRGMAFMKSGKLQDAEAVFTHGIKVNPWASQNQYFKTALATLRLQQNDFRQVLELTEGVSLPALLPIAKVLSMHAFGELGHIPQFHQASQSVRDSSPPGIIDLKKMLTSYYRKHAHTKPFMTRDFAFQKECDSLLLAV